MADCCHGNISIHYSMTESALRMTGTCFGTGRCHLAFACIKYCFVFLTGCSCDGNFLVSRLIAFFVCRDIVCHHFDAVTGRNCFCKCIRIKGPAAILSQYNPGCLTDCHNAICNICIFRHLRRDCRFCDGKWLLNGLCAVTVGIYHHIFPCISYLVSLFTISRNRIIPSGRIRKKLFFHYCDRLFAFCKRDCCSGTFRQIISGVCKSHRNRNIILRKIRFHLESSISFQTAPSCKAARICNYERSIICNDRIIGQCLSCRNNQADSVCNL